MGARKGQNNFRTLQVRKVQSNCRLISHVLTSIKKGIVFKKLDSLIVFVSRETKVHRTTIKRNPEYMRLVLDYFANQPGAVGVINDEDANAAALRAKLIASKTRIRNLETDLERQRRCEQARILCSSSVGKDDSYVSFINTAITLLIVLERLTEKELGISVDLSKKQIIDIAEVGDRRVIVGPTRTKWFFDWLSLEPTAIEYARQLASGHPHNGATLSVGLSS